MKFMPLAILVILFTSCGQNKKEKTVTPEAAVDSTAFITTAIVDYYQQHFNKEHAADSKNRLRIDTTGDKEIQVKTMFDSTSTEGSLNIIPVAAKFLKGDLNGDKRNDYIIPVYSTGGGNVSWTELFVFTSNNGQLNMMRMYSSYDLGHCEATGGIDGQFFPEKIDSSGLLVGESACYALNDPSCCPTIKWTTRYKVSNNTLTLADQVKKN
jgi:hypothetical protein